MWVWLWSHSFMQHPSYGYERIDIDECVADYVYDRDIDKLFTKSKN